MTARMRRFDLGTLRPGAATNLSHLHAVGSDGETAIAFWCLPFQFTKVFCYVTNDKGAYWCRWFFCELSGRTKNVYFCNFIFSNFFQNLLLFIKIYQMEINILLIGQSQPETGEKPMTIQAAAPLLKRQSYTPFKHNFLTMIETAGIL